MERDKKLSCFLHISFKSFSYLFCTILIGKNWIKCINHHPSLLKTKGAASPPPLDPPPCIRFWQHLLQLQNLLLVPEIFESVWSIYVIPVSFEEGFEVELLRIFFQAYRMFVFYYNIVHNLTFFRLNLNLDNMYDLWYDFCSLNILDYPALTFSIIELRCRIG